MAKTEEELIDEAIDRGLDDAQIQALLTGSLPEATAPTKPVRAAAAPRPVAPRPAAPRPVAQAPMVTMAAPRVTAPVPVEPAMEAMVTPVRPIAAPAPVPVAAPAVPAARLKAEEEIQLAQMLDEQRAIREQQNVQWAQQALEPLQTLFGPGLAVAPMTGPAAPLVAAGSLGLAALAPVAGAAASGLSKLGVYGSTEATPAMREEARRRAQGAVQRQQFVAEEPNLGERFVSTIGDVLEDVVRPYVGLFEEAKAIPQALDRRKRPGVVAAAGKLLVGTPLTEEQEAVRLGGQFAENLKRVQSAPDQLIAVGPRAEKGAATGRTYEQIVSPKVAARNHPKEFEAWSKQFPEQAKKIREEISKAGDAGRISNKLAAGNVPSNLDVPKVEQERLARAAAMGKTVPIPSAQEMGVTSAQRAQLLRNAGVTSADLKAGTTSEATIDRLRGMLAAP